MTGLLAYCERKRFGEPISLNLRNRRRLPIKTTYSPRPICKVSYINN